MEGRKVGKRQGGKKTWKDLPLTSYGDVCLSLSLLYVKWRKWYLPTVVNQGLPERTFVECWVWLICFFLILSLEKFYNSSRDLPKPFGNFQTLAYRYISYTTLNWILMASFWSFSVWCVVCYVVLCGAMWCYVVNQGTISDRLIIDILLVAWSWP